MKDPLLDEFRYVNERLGTPDTIEERSISRMSYRQIAKRHGIEGRAQTAAGIILKIIIVLQGSPSSTVAEIRKLVGCANVLIRPAIDAAIHLGALEVSARATRGRPAVTYRCCVDDVQGIAAKLREAAA